LTQTLAIEIERSGGAGGRDAEQGAICPTQGLVVGVRRREPHGLPQLVRWSSLRSAPRRRACRCKIRKHFFLREVAMMHVSVITSVLVQINIGGYTKMRQSTGIIEVTLQETPRKLKIASSSQ
ncbi:unnamed protein product, partial [Musa hybrid cultivar]